MEMLPFSWKLFDHVLKRWKTGGCSNGYIYLSFYLRKIKKIYIISKTLPYLIGFYAYSQEMDLLWMNQFDQI